MIVVPPCVTVVTWLVTLVIVVTTVVNFVVKLTTVAIVLSEDEVLVVLELVVLGVVEVVTPPYVNVADPVTGALCPEATYTAVTA